MEEQLDFLRIKNAELKSKHFAEECRYNRIYFFFFLDSFYFCRSKEKRENFRSWNILKRFGLARNSDFRL